MLLGCIGDDFTGSSDLANTLSKSGMRAVQYCGVPANAAAADVEAGVVALKSRTIDAEDAVRQSLQALDWLRAQGCRQYFFKYCSTFDSTDKGNIGPVADALSDALDADAVVFCPAFPETGRTIYQGHLFVKDVLLSESGMQNHPLTPMRDPDLRRVLAAQSKSRVGHVPLAVVQRGAHAVRKAMEGSADTGARFLIVDAVSNDDLKTIGAACASAKLITGGSGIALGLPANFAREGLLKGSDATWSGLSGRAACLAGSVSVATRGQIEAHGTSGAPAHAIDVEAVMAQRLSAADLADWFQRQEEASVPLAYSSAAPESVRALQERFGKQQVAESLERLFAETAVLLADRGFTRIVSAGGETSGAIVEALGIEALEIGPEIDPGVPALKVTGRPLVVTLKSGNFGAEDFFRKAADVLAGAT